MWNAECGIEEEGVEARWEGWDAARRQYVHSAFRIPHSAFSRSAAPPGASEALPHAESPRAVTKLPVILAVTGASGAPYGVRLLEILATHHVPTWLLVSSHGWRLLAEECGLEDDRELKKATGGDWASVRVFDDQDRGARSEERRVGKECRSRW